MSDYLAPTQDIQFVIEEIAELESIAALPGYEDATSELVEAVLEQAGKMAGEVFAPLNHAGDEHGTRIEDGVVISPPGYSEAYRQFVDNGWQADAGASKPGRSEAQSLDAGEHGTLVARRRRSVSVRLRCHEPHRDQCRHRAAARPYARPLR